MSGMLENSVRTFVFITSYASYVVPFDLNNLHIVHGHYGFPFSYISTIIQRFITWKWRLL